LVPERDPALYQPPLLRVAKLRAHVFEPVLPCTHVIIFSSHKRSTRRASSHERATLRRSRLCRIEQVGVTLSFPPTAPTIPRDATGSAAPSVREITMKRVCALAIRGRTYAWPTRTIRWTLHGVRTGDAAPRRGADLPGAHRLARRARRRGAPGSTSYLLYSVAGEKGIAIAALKNLH
jgi:hypothetical protein